MAAWAGLAAAALALMASAAGGDTVNDRFIPIAGMTVVCPSAPTDAEALAANRFAAEVRRICGLDLPILLGGEPRGACVRLGNWATHADLLRARGHAPPPERDGEDVARQSYVVEALSKAGARRHEVLAAGLGADRSARGHLGTGYALGELLRRLDLRRGRWGFTLPGAPIIGAPATPNRTLYIMNSSLRNPGLSVEYFTDEQIADYVDRLVEARYSRVCHFAWADMYLYPGNSPGIRADMLALHQAMRRFYDRARRRGLEVYHQITPAHANTRLLPDDPKLVATGYYGWTSVCWSQPVARELAQKMARTEMEYYGPVDGYMVWFYDPGGCFCADCAANQADRLYDQLMTVVEHAPAVSPGARFQMGLWPTWAFARDKERIGHPGRGYTEEEVKGFVTDLLRRCLARFGTRKLTILDSCEGDETNIYNGYVDPREFKRSGFMYTALGMASEQTYPFAAFRIGYLSDKMTLAKQRGLEEAQIFIQYSATNFPGVFAFADTLYEAGATKQSTTARLAATLARGEAREPFLALLAGMEGLAGAPDRAALEKAVAGIEQAAARLEATPHFAGDREWLRGFVKAQRWYLKLGQEQDAAAFDALVAQFKADLATVPLWQHYATNTMSPALARAHVKQYWPAAAK